MTFLRAAVLSLFASACAFAGGPADPAKLYEVLTDGSSKAVSAGEQAKLVIAIKAKEGAHVSDEAPLRIELSGTNATPAKTKITLADSLTPKPAAGKFANPVFEVPYTVTTAGKATMDAKLTFFICTEQLCSRQQKTLSLALDVAPAKKTL